MSSISSDISIASFALVALSYLSKSQLLDDEKAMQAISSLYDRIDPSLRPVDFDSSKAVKFARMGDKVLENKIKQLREQQHLSSLD